MMLVLGFLFLDIVVRVHSSQKVFLDDVKYAYQIKDDGDHISYIDHDPMSLSPTEDLDTNNNNNSNSSDRNSYPI